MVYFCRNEVRVILGSDKGDILKGSVRWFQQMRSRHMSLRAQLQYDVERSEVVSSNSGRYHSRNLAFSDGSVGRINPLLFR